MDYGVVCVLLMLYGRAVRLRIASDGTVARLAPAEASRLHHMVMPCRRRPVLGSGSRINRSKLPRAIRTLPAPPPLLPSVMNMSKPRIKPQKQLGRYRLEGRLSHRKPRAGEAHHASSALEHRHVARPNPHLAYSR